jgi:hypothetical protein
MAWWFTSLLVVKVDRAMAVANSKAAAAQDIRLQRRQLATDPDAATVLTLTQSQSQTGQCCSRASGTESLFAERLQLRSLEGLVPPPLGRVDLEPAP